MTPTSRSAPGANALSPAQTRALEHVRAQARALTAALPLRHGRHELSALLAASAPITLSFHPDRLLGDGRSVAAGLLAAGVYRGQFETHISNGSRTAHVGGERDGWEMRLFDAAYQGEGTKPHERPKYGALALMGYADGAAPRFGSCYLELHPTVAERATFCFGDSHLGPSVFGTSDCLEPIVEAIFLSHAETGSALGTAFSSENALDAHLRTVALQEGSAAALGRALDDYVEAQIHGDVVLERDVARLIIDPSFRGTEVGSELAALGARYGIEILQHPGFVVRPDEIPEAFRGAALPPFARAVAALSADGERPRGGRYDAAALGRAAAAQHRDPGVFARHGDPEAVLQLLKHAWHALVRFG